MPLYNFKEKYEVLWDVSVFGCLVHIMSIFAWLAEELTDVFSMLWAPLHPALQPARICTSTSTLHCFDTNAQRTTVTHLLSATAPNKINKYIFSQIRLYCISFSVIYLYLWNARFEMLQSEMFVNHFWKLKQSSLVCVYTHITLMDGF